MGTETSVAADAVMTMPEVQRALALVSDARFSVDLSLLKELRLYMRDATSRQNFAPATFKSEQDLQRLGESIEALQRLRCRVSEIKLHHLWARRALRRCRELAADHLVIEGPLAELRPQTRRDAAIRLVLRDVIERIDDLDVIMEAADDTDRQLGNAYFALKELVAINTRYLEARRNERGA